jgi:hypothetical protein
VRQVHEQITAGAIRQAGIVFSHVAVEIVPHNSSPKVSQKH